MTTALKNYREHLDTIHAIKGQKATPLQSTSHPVRMSVWGMDDVHRNRTLNQSFIYHEIRNILYFCMRNVEVIEIKSKDPKVKDFTTPALCACELGKQLMDQVSSIQEAEKQVVDLVPMLENLLNMLRNIHPDISFSLEASSRAEVYVLPNISNVFTNILLNAVRAIEEKKMKTRMTGVIIAKILVFEKKEEVPQAFQIDFQDNGIGMNEEEVGKIFTTKFTTKKDGLGGFGTLIAHEIITASNGHIRVSSEKGTGTVFSIIIPSFSATCF